MTTMISELYEALVDAGASEEKAREAAVALSAEGLSAKGNIAEVKEELARLDKKMAVMQWMLGTTLAGVAAILASVVPILVKLFFAA